MSLSDLAAVVSAAVAALSAVWARQAARAAVSAEKRASTIAATAGQLDSVRTTMADGDRYALIVVNGPDELVIDRLSLNVSYVHPPDNLILPRGRTRFPVDPSEFYIFGVEGPALPVVLPPRHKATWTMPRGRPDQDGAQVEYAWTVGTANDATGSATWTVSRGSIRPTLLKQQHTRPWLFWLWVTNRYGSFDHSFRPSSGRLVDIISLEQFPMPVRVWLLRLMSSPSQP